MEHPLQNSRVFCGVRYVLLLWIWYAHTGSLLYNVRPSLAQMSCWRSTYSKQTHQPFHIHLSSLSAWADVCRSRRCWWIETFLSAQWSSSHSECKRMHALNYLCMRVFFIFAYARSPAAHTSQYCEHTLLQKYFYKCSKKSHWGLHYFCWLE